MKKIFQTTGEIISDLVDSKSGLNLKKPFQKAGEILTAEVKKIFKTTGEYRRNHSRRLEKSLKKVKKICQTIGDNIQDYQLTSQVLL